MDDNNDPLAVGVQSNQTEDKNKEIETLTNSWKRAVADYQNLEKRVSKEREDFVKFSNLLIISRLIGLLDNLEMVKTHLRDEGLDIVCKELKNIILEHGVREMALEIGGEFDPNLAECVEAVVADFDNKIIEIVAKGYIIGERVVRPAKVKVSKLDKKPDL